MKLSGYFLLIFLLSCNMSCMNKGAEAKPALSQKAIVPIMYELMLSEEYSRQVFTKDSTIKLDSMTVQKFNQVFSLHKTNREDFSASYQYYLGHPDMLKAILDSINAVGGRRRVEIIHPSFKNRDKINRSPVKLNKDSLQ